MANMRERESEGERERERESRRWGGAQEVISDMDSGERVDMVL